ncbi:hypothetical protein P0F20_001514 [Vibrio metschnikovii]|nr:hypothetical protein [Vibrio metschnikovii]
MKKIEDFYGQAEKINGNGHIHYFLWMSEVGVLYVQMLENDVKTKNPGTLDKYLFEVKPDFVVHRNTSEKLNVANGWSIENQKFEEVKNNNTSAFLKAVLKDLFPVLAQA